MYPKMGPKITQRAPSRGEDDVNKYFFHVEILNSLQEIEKHVAN